MRILHVCQPTDGGSAVVVRELARRGVESGDDVSVACPDQGFLPRWTQDVGARWIKLPMTRAPSVTDVVSLLLLRRIVAGSDIVHLHSSKAGALGRLALSLRRRPRSAVVFTPHAWSWYVESRLSLVYRLFEQWAGRLTDVITVVSADELRSGREVLRGKAEIVLIENGVDTDLFAPDGDTAPRTAAPLLVQVGRLCEQKGQDRAIRALALVSDRLTRLRLIGDGPDREYLAALARSLGVDQRVEFLGSADPRPHLRAADVVLLPSRWEGMSLVLLEAMSTEAAIITTNCGGSDALGDAGKIITNLNDHDTVCELSIAIDHLLANPDDRELFGRNARVRVVSKYSVAKTVQRYVEVWEGVTRNGVP